MHVGDCSDAATGRESFRVPACRGPIVIDREKKRRKNKKSP